jgi:hypothetical protein
MKTLFGQSWSRFGLFGQTNGGVAFTLAITGGSTDSLGIYARVGGHASIGYVETPASGVETVKWSNSANPAAAATYGTGASPTDFTAGDGGTLYLHVTVGADTVSRSLPIRRLPATAANGLGPFSWTVDDTVINVDFKPQFTLNGNTLTYVITGRSSGVADDGDGTISGTPGAAGSGTLICTGTDLYGRTVASSASFTNALRTQAVGGTDLDLTFPAGVAITPVDLIQNWTTNGNTLTFLSISPALPSGLSIDADGDLSGTPVAVVSATYTLTMVDEYGRNTSDTLSLETRPAVNPELDALTFNAGTQELIAPYTYAGADSLIAIVALRSGGTANTGPNMVANTGTWIERGVVDPFSVDEFDLTGLFTAAADGANAVDVVIAEKNNGGVSNVETTAVSGLDLDPGTETLELTGGRTDGILITYTGTLTITGSRTDGLRIEAA